MNQQEHQPPASVAVAAVHSSQAASVGYVSSRAQANAGTPGTAAEAPVLSVLSMSASASSSTSFSSSSLPSGSTATATAAATSSTRSTEQGVPVQTQDLVSGEHDGESKAPSQASLQDVATSPLSNEDRPNLLETIMKADWSESEEEYVPSDDEDELQRGPAALDESDESSESNGEDADEDEFEEDEDRQDDGATEGQPKPCDSTGSGSSQIVAGNNSQAASSSGVSGVQNAQSILGPSGQYRKRGGAVVGHEARTPPLSPARLMSGHSKNLSEAMSGMLASTVDAASSPSPGLRSPMREVVSVQPAHHPPLSAAHTSHVHHREEHRSSQQPRSPLLPGMRESSNDSMFGGFRAGMGNEAHHQSRSGWSSAASTVSNVSRNRRHDRRSRQPNISLRTRAKHSLQHVDIDELEKTLYGVLEDNEEYLIDVPYTNFLEGVQRYTWRQQRQGAAASASGMLGQSTSSGFNSFATNSASNAHGGAGLLAPPQGLQYGSDDDDDDDDDDDVEFQPEQDSNEEEDDDELDFVANLQISQRELDWLMREPFEEPLAVGINTLQPLRAHVELGAPYWTKFYPDVNERQCVSATRDVSLAPAFRYCSAITCSRCACFVFCRYKELQRQTHLLTSALLRLFLKSSQHVETKDAFFKISRMLLRMRDFTCVHICEVEVFWLSKIGLDLTATPLSISTRALCVLIMQARLPPCSPTRNSGCQQHRRVLLQEPGDRQCGR